MTSESVFDTKLTGPLRGILRTVDNAVQEHVEELWKRLADPEAATSAIAAHAGFASTRKGVLRDLLYLMIAEHAAYRHNIRAEHGDYYDAKSTELSMKIDSCEQCAEHLAAQRALDRSLRQPVRETWGEVIGGDRAEAWMKVD